MPAGGKFAHGAGTGGHREPPLQGKRHMVQEWAGRPRPNNGVSSLPKKGVTFDLKGLKAVEAAFSEKLKGITHYSLEATTDIVLDLTGRAAAEAPVETGALRGSGKGEVNEVIVVKGIKSEDKVGRVEATGAKPPDRKIIKGVVSFSEAYAVTQHEMINYKHPKGGKAKYLEDPFKANMNRYIQRYKDGIKKGCKS